MILLRVLLVNGITITYYLRLTFLLFQLELNFQIFCHQKESFKRDLIKWACEEFASFFTKMYKHKDLFDQKFYQ